MAIHLDIRVLDIISEVPISPDLKTTLFVQEEPLYHYIASSNFCIYASEYLCDGETKFPIEQSNHFNLSLGHESITNFIPVKQMIHFFMSDLFLDIHQSAQEWHSFMHQQEW